MSIRHSILVAAAALAATACSGSNSAIAEVTPRPATPTIASSVLGGDSDALAVELLLAGARSDQLAWHLQQRAVADPALAVAVDAMANDHIKSTVLGGDAGPALLGANAVRQLAAKPGAPIDQNQQNGNLDETLAAEAARVTAFAGAAAPAVNALPMLPWRSRSAELRAELSAGGSNPSDNASWRTQDLGDRTVDLKQVAHFLQLRSTAARRLLRDRRPGSFGSAPDTGSIGLLAMQQILAAEDTLFSALFTSGGALGPLDNPSAYDPLTAPRWLPRSVTVDLDPAVAGAPGGFRTLDGASDLQALGTLLSAGADLSLLASPAAPLALSELFRNTPYSPPPVPQGPASISWLRDIGPLLRFRCGFCHLQQTFGGFSISTYESMLTGGNKTRFLNLPFIVPGNAAASQLHKILIGPQLPFVKMPFAGELRASEFSLIEAWINEGALELPLAPPAPPRPGDDVALVSFRNLAALHFDPASGALHHRYTVEGRSGIATALATGRALRGLADYARAKPGAEFGGRTIFDLLHAISGHAVAQLLNGLGHAFDSVHIATGTPTGTANLETQAAMTAGLLAAAAELPSGHPAGEAGRRATLRLLSAFRASGNGEGHFGNDAGLPASSYSAATLTELLAALRLADAAGVVGAADARRLLLTRVRPALAFAEWEGHGEVFGDGIADTDGDGLREPAAAGGPFGRLPLLADRITIDPIIPQQSRAPTWSEHVRPLLLSKCSECHMNGNENGDYRLDTLASLQTPGESMGQFPMLVPGDAEASFFFQKLSRRQPPLGTQMPQARTPLDAAAVSLIRQWIDLGASAR